MADGMTVPGIQASFGLDTTELDNALQKVRSGMADAAEKIRNAQKELMAGSMSAIQFAKAVKQAQSEQQLLQRTASDLTNQIQAQKSAIGDSISHSNAWGQVIQQSAAKSAQFTAELKAQADALAAFYAEAAATRGGGVNVVAADAMQSAAAATRQYTTAMRGVSGESEIAMNRSRAFAMALMQVGYVVDDVQYGFQAIVNNLGPLAQHIGVALGATGPQAAAAAAGVQILGVAAYQAYKHWDELMEVMGTDRVLTEAEHMERLAKATEKSADEAERLRGYKERETEVKRQQGSQSKDEAAATKEARAAIDEDRDAVKRGLIQTRRGMLSNRPEARKTADELAEMKRQLQQQQREQASLIRNGDEADPQLADAIREQKRKIAAKEKELENKLNTEADNYLAEAALNQNGRRQELANVMRQNPGAFGPHGAAIQEKLENATPEKIKEKELEKRTKRIAKNHEEYTQRQIREQEHEDQELARQRRENLKAAKDAIPGVEDRTKRRIREGGSQYDALKKELMGLGFGEEDAAQAAEQINHEATNKVTAENQDPEYQRQQRHRARQRGLEAVPGLNKMAEQMELQGIAQGMKPEQIWKSVTGRIRKALSDAGLKGDELNNATSEIATQADRDLKKEVVKEALKEPEIRHSEVFDAGEINRRVQQSVGGDPHKKAEGQREQMIKYLATMAQANGNVLQLKIDE